MAHWSVVTRMATEITRDDFVRLIDAIERGEPDGVIVRDIDRLTARVRPA
jgi:DNA invertase Pin-like site-specific DNA recombinase